MGVLSYGSPMRLWLRVANSFVYIYSKTSVNTRLLMKLTFLCIRYIAALLSPADYCVMTFYTPLDLGMQGTALSASKPMVTINSTHNVPVPVMALLMPWDAVGRPDVTIPGLLWVTLWPRNYYSTRIVTESDHTMSTSVCPYIIGLYWIKEPVRFVIWMLH